MGSLPPLDLSEKDSRGIWCALLSLADGAAVMAFHFASFVLHDPNVSAWGLECTEDTQLLVSGSETTINTHDQEMHDPPVQHAPGSSKVAPELNCEVESATQHVSRQTSKLRMKDIAAKSVLGFHLDEGSSTGWMLAQFGSVWWQMFCAL